MDAAVLPHVTVTIWRDAMDGDDLVEIAHRVDALYAITGRPDPSVGVFWPEIEVRGLECSTLTAAEVDALWDDAELLDRIVEQAQGR